LARAATILETLRAQYPDQVVLVDAGDLIEGNLFAAYFARRDQERPHPLVDALNAMQYDAATPGNHDFDFGPSGLARALQDATYRYVSANVYRGGTDTLLYAPYSGIERAGVKVGSTGFTTPGVMGWDRGPLGGRVRVRRIEETAPAAVQRLEQAGAEVRVVLIHSGRGEPASYDPPGVGRRMSGCAPGRRPRSAAPAPGAPAGSRGRRTRRCSTSSTRCNAAGRAPTCPPRPTSTWMPDSRRARSACATSPASTRTRTRYARSASRGGSCGNTSSTRGAISAPISRARPSSTTASRARTTTSSAEPTTT